MEPDIDDYLKSTAALNETKSIQGRMLHPGEPFGGFRVVAFLGRGATGEVWRVHDESLNADFAMKIFAPSETSTEKETARLRRRFIAEARCLAQFTHPGIVRVHVLQAKGEYPFYTMDMLHPIVRPLAKRKATTIISDVLSALDATHAKGIVHRDIKPANVLLDDNGNALLTDFGIAQIDNTETAKKITTPQTTTATASIGSVRIAGTPDFSAPEQFIGADATPASDLHAVGRLALWLFDGKPPLSWRWFIMRATNSSPALRYKSAKAMQRTLTAARLSWRVACALAVLIPATIATLLVFHEAPPPIRLDVDDDVYEANLDWNIPGVGIMENTRTQIITLEGGHSYKIGLLRGWQFYRDLKNGKLDGPYREPLIIQGNGTLYADRIAWLHVQLKSGVKLVTSGEYHGFVFSRWNKDKHKDEDVEYPSRPPQNATLTNAEQTVYAAYIVEPGAELVFTDNPSYPESLIDRRQRATCGQP